MTVSRPALLRMISVSDKAVQNINTHILCYITSFREVVFVYEIMWTDTVEPVKPQMAVNGAHAICTLDN